MPQSGDAATMATMSKAYITTRQAAVLLGVCVQRVRQMIASGELRTQPLPPRANGRTLAHLVSASSVRALKNSRDRACKS